MKNSMANERGYHEVPQDWLEDARAFKHHLIDALMTDSDLLVSVRPAYKGGWKHGYSWSGSFVIKVRNNKPNGYCAGQEFVKYVKGQKLQPIEKWYNKIKPRLDTEAMGIRVVALYRRSDLIPKHIAKQYGRQIKEKLGISSGSDQPVEQWSIYQNRDYVTLSLIKAAKYIRRYGKCPHCGERRGIMEHILGWVCTHCGSTWEDITIQNLHWHKPSK